MGVSLSGLVSGFDWQSFIDQMAEVERLPQQRLRVEQADLREQSTAYGSLITELKSLQNSVAALKESSLYGSRTVSVGDETVASASTAADATQGVYTFHFSQLATAARLVGSNGSGLGISQSLHTADVTLAGSEEGPTLSESGFYPPATSGTITINGYQVTIDSSKTLKAVFQDISDQTGGTIEAGYDTETDTMTLNRVGGGDIILGSATDSSNFLQAAKLYNTPSGAGPITSSGALGSARLGVALASANLATAINTGFDGGGQPNATGTFTINGKDITFSATDTLATVMQRINDSDAGVTASYDAVNDRFSLTSKATGDIGIAVQDKQGNFLEALGFLGSTTLERGQDATYTVNGGSEQRSRSNTITGDASGITGLTVTALKEGGTTTVTVGSDTATIKDAIEGFVAQYNKVQSMIDSKTAVTVEDDGSVAASVLANQREAEEAATSLRGMVFGSISGLSGVINQLEKLGYTTNSEDNKLKLEDTAKLDAALATDLDAVQEFFSTAGSGLAVKLDAYLERLVGDDGSLITKQTNLDKRATAIDTQVADLERLVLAQIDTWKASFVAMEQAQQQLNQQLTYLLNQFSSSPKSSS